MYDELVKRLWECVREECWNCSQHKDSYDGQRTCADNLMKQAADAIEELTALSRRQEVELVKLTGELASKPRWIPVSERLPEEGRPVLATYLGFHDRSPRANMLAYIDRDLGWCWWNDDIPDGSPCIVEITHRMPLPQPPKEE